MIDNKRLFVVQSRGELREGGERQVFFLREKKMTMLMMMRMMMMTLSYNRNMTIV